MDLGFNGATVVVTGGSKGMGLAIAESLGAEFHRRPARCARRRGAGLLDPKHVMAWVEQTFGHPCDIGRAGLPEEVASVTVYLASRRNGYVTGATVNVDGGSDFI
jgi:NAD(P)-dependent dehydrogenase (short-subunit alcohol dehydrogenase family)